MKIIYHANCCDGFCGAWLLSKLYPDAEFLPFSYGMPTVIEKAAIQLDFTKMDRAANKARAAVFEQVADKAKDFKDLQALIDWQDAQLRAGRLKAYQPWVELLTQQLDEDRYDPQVAEKIFRAAARASNSQ